MDAFVDEDLKLLMIEDDDLVDSISDPRATPLRWNAVNEEDDGWDGYDA